MPKFDALAHNPGRYKRVAEAQTKLLGTLVGQPSAVRLCPYCDHKIAVLYPGYHGPESTKCPNCGEVIIMPAVKISRTITHTT